MLLSFQQLGVGERSSEAAGSAAVLRQIIPSRIWRTASYHWGKGLHPLHSCSGQAVLKDSSSGVNMYREPAYSPVLSIADQRTGLFNMLRSPIFALDPLGVGNRPAADSHRTIGISATPPSLWPGCELQKYLLWSTGRLNYSVFKEPIFIENFQKLSLPKNYPSNW